MWINLVLALSSAFAGFALWARPGVVGMLAVGFVALSGWQLFSAVSHVRRSPVILRLGGFSWTEEDFCRGWLITGETGSGKTLAGINAMLWQVTQNCPTWGGVCIDDKGLYWETLSDMMRRVGRSDDLILLKVRPEDAPSDWKPPHTLNVLDYQGLAYSAKAKSVCDVAASLGQGGDQSFFRSQAVLWMEFAFRSLACAELPVTLDDAYDFLTSEEEILEVMARVAAKRGQPEADALIQQFLEDFLEQPKEQLGGTKATLANRLKYFTDRDLSAVFCPVTSSVDFRDIDRGKIICVAIPQRYQAERRYIHTLLKLLYFAHAQLRFDRPAEQRAKDNLLILWGDEAQKIVTANDDGTSDYNVVDVIREARATMVFATQSYTSLIPPVGDENKAKVLIANLANRITFKAADEASARIAADTIGKRTIKKRTYGYSMGRRSSSYTDEEKYWVEPHELRRLMKFNAIVQHCERGFRRVKLPPRGTDGKVLSWYQS